ncbi:MAG TPA: hypothetical protein VF155_04470 [Candidatus Dormibacteraeota bacterium]
MRALTEKEATLLSRLVGSVEGGSPLLCQIEELEVSDDTTPTFLRLVAPEALRDDGFRDGRLRGRFPVLQHGRVTGEVIVWLKDGRLDGLEHAWIAGAAPSGMPDPDDVDVEGV